MKKILAVILVLAMAASLVACQPASESEPDNTAEATEPETAPEEEASQEPVRDDIVLSMNGEPTALDPQQTANGRENAIEMQIFDGLLQYDIDGRSVMGNIATDWTVSEDGLTYTFTIKNDVKFHDGSTLTVEDIVYSMEMASESAYTSNLNVISTVEAVDDSTVVITLSAPYALFLEKLASPDGAGIVCKAAREAMGAEAYAQSPIGSGPYMFTEWVPGEKIVLTAFPDYHQGTAAITNLTIRFIADSTSSTLAVESGEVDVSSNVSTADLQAVNSDIVSVFDAVGTHFNYFAINCANEKMADVRIRQAIAYALDKESIIIVAKEGHATPADSIAYQTLNGYSADAIATTYDPEHAKQLLADAGFADGFDLEIKVLGGSYAEKIAQMALDNLAAIGITVTITSMDYNAFVNDATGGNFEMLWFAVDEGTYDLSLCNSILSTGGSYNLSAWSNARYDELNSIIMTSSNNEERAAQVAEMQSIVDTEVPIIPLFWSNIIYVHTNGLKGLDQCNSRGINFYRLSW